MLEYRLFTSESVTEGHPDKVCDRVSDSILDALLRQDRLSRVAVETCCKGQNMYLLGEVTSRADIDYAAVARKAIADTGYNDASLGFDATGCNIVVNIERQSPDIAMGVDASVEAKSGGDKYDIVGAGDQGMMFGYACDETEELMPLAIALSHRLTARLSKVRKEGILPYLRPDGKAQVTMQYDNDKPVKVHTVVISSQHSADIDMDTLRADIRREVIDKVIPAELNKGDMRVFINPTGRFVIGGPAGDSGLTGRKIIADTYGGYCPHGGGAFSGKDPTKVDRSACYMARYVCKNVVAARLARRCEVQIAYAIGVAHPVSVAVNTFGTGKVSDSKLSEIIAKVFDLRPAAIADQLDLLNPIYAATCNYGHFGREGFSWERTDKADVLAALAEE
ncbi:MAG: methionine adenosyltransferase [Clostridia bacterium]|nr:methionine adenosyltransferase [Clostridia bacterium]